MHNTPEENEAFRRAWDATNARWKAQQTPTNCPKCPHGLGFNCRQCWPKQYRNKPEDLTPCKN